MFHVRDDVRDKTNQYLCSYHIDIPLTMAIMMKMNKETMTNRCIKSIWNLLSTLLYYNLQKTTDDVPFSSSSFYITQQEPTFHFKPSTQKDVDVLLLIFHLNLFWAGDTHTIYCALISTSFSKQKLSKYLFYSRNSSIIDACKKITVRLSLLLVSCVLNNVTDTVLVAS